ncbi:MAG: hypothetical protein ACKVOU_06205 [Cytophagales bacterium]
MNKNIYFEWISKTASQYSIFQLILGAIAIIVVFLFSYYFIFKIVKQSITKQYRVPHLMYKFLFKPGLILFCALGLWFVVKWLAVLVPSTITVYPICRTDLA